MLRVGIPEYRLPRNILETEIDSIKRLGVEIKNNVTFGKDITLDKLFKKGYKAIFIAIGAHKAQGLDIPGDDSDGVLHGIEFLQNISLGTKVKVGRKTVVIGGGNVAIDAARSALRLGSKEVVIIYRRSRDEMLAREEEISSCESEGIRIEYLVAPNRILTEDGKAVGIECIRMRLGNRDVSGRRLPVPIAGSEFTVDADMIISAIGQTPEIVFMRGDQGIEITDRGTLAVDSKSLSTTRYRVYAGGDVVYGPATVVEAIAAGKKAALNIDTALKGQKAQEEKKGKVIEYKDLKVDYFSKEPRQVGVELPIGKRRLTFREVSIGLNKSAVISEAKRCFHCGECNLCKICSSFCPEGILLTSIETGWKPDLDQCKGCGICANECPRGAVEMVLER
jgi:NADPH-dependent glutamate synthase beta subunit-like oxidoreductase